ncbi:MAG: response regulator [Burkholderiales bacterium]|nr:response regulator [Burkholderiales bacterium]
MMTSGALALGALVALPAWLAAGLALRRSARALAASRSANAELQQRVEALARLEALVDSADEAIFAKDLEGRYLFFNREAERVTGKSRAEVLGRDDHVLFPPPQAQMLRRRGLEVIERGCSLTEEEVLDTVGGRRIFRATKGPLRDAAGRIVGEFGLSTDVTEQRNAEAALRGERELLREMSAIGQIGGWEHDLRADTMTWTEGMARILDLDPATPPTPELALGMLEAPSRAALRAAQDQALAQGRRYDVEVQVRTPLGRRKTARIVAWPQLEDGRVRRLRGILQDTTAQARLHAEIEDHRQNLEAQVRARTEELREARERAETASRAKSAFLANMSHEMRTPLNAILGFARLLERSALDRQQAGRVRKIDESATHLLGLVSDVLDLSQVESGELVLAQRDFELGAVMAEVRDAVAPAAAAKALALGVEPGALPLWLRGDPARLRQALLNFASNAVKFTPSGSVRIHCGRREAADGRVALHFEVCDTGIGIAPENQPRLFEMFEPGDASTTRRFDGSGLGLAITRRLAELMGGRVGVQSELGQGSCFWLDVALARGNAPVEPEADAENLVRVRHAGMRVLVVEDNPVNREVAAELLAAAGLEVALAENGQIALDALAHERPDLVLMDLQMPVMDGLQASAEIRRRPGLEGLPVLAMTANVTAEMRRACTEVGMKDFIGKPVVAQRLYETLLRWLPQRAVAQPAPVIDQAGALRRSGGKAERALRLQRLFRDSHRDDGARLAALREGADWTGLRRLAHGLAGAGGNVGATEVHRLASALEAAVVAGEPAPRLEQASRALEAALEACMVALDALGDAVAPPEQPTQPGIDSAGAARQLLTLLAAGDMASAGFLAEHGPALRPVLGDTLAPLGRLVSTFRFSEAEALLRPLLEPAPVQVAS